MLAICYNHHNLIKLLLQQPHLDINSENCIGWTGLHFASAEDDVTTLSKLLSRPGAGDVNQTSSSGTALTVAVDYGSLGCVRNLCGREDVDLGVRDGGGRCLEDIAR